MGQNVDTDSHLLFYAVAVGGAALDGVEYFCKLVAEEDGNNRGRRLVCAETVVVCGGCNGNTEDFLIIVDSLDRRAEEKQELSVFGRSFARLEQV